MAIELYKEDQGSLPADLTTLGGSDYLDSWPGDPYAALRGGGDLLVPGSWPALQVVTDPALATPGCLLYEPGVLGQAQWVRTSQSSPEARPELAYRLSFYSGSPSIGPLTIEATPLTYEQQRQYASKLGEVVWQEWQAQQSGKQGLASSN
jgi:hypothetical protein